MMGKFSRLLIHITGCAAFLALPIVFSPDAHNLADLWQHPPAVRDFLVYLALLLFFYFNFFWLIPSFYFKRKYGGFFLIAFLCFVAIVILPGLLSAVTDGQPPQRYQWPANNPMPIPREDQPPPPPPGRFHEGPYQQPPSSHYNLILDVGHRLFLFLAIFFFPLILRIRDRWKQTEREKLNAELSYLKAQINPHFLFNTLNTIYSLAVEKSDQTPTAVIELSDMMRYVLSDAGQQMVPLQKEISYIHNYIALQQLRFGTGIPVSFTVNGKTEGKQIPPLILISFVENAFKHGVNAAENSNISINVHITGHELHFTAFNNKVTTPAAPEEGGLGIENTRRRLQLIYPGRHILDIRDETGSFTVSLVLQLL
ncbi:sensor histidine kinase [Chitinophaga tropicalis]|uniref:Sensor histidine kinase n=1 Tax=Chitinophaga tropicalis TaxID=2683588 RepID=A0A7K1TZI9_9BACT|nr:sensor histidine kinase [Chitinophaga tropicalis]MVT07528.1 sensor histidine kinase [Chitinophaga tropicalis]